VLRVDDTDSAVLRVDDTDSAVLRVDDTDSAVLRVDDTYSADAVTLVRQHEVLLARFVCDKLVDHDQRLSEALVLGLLNVSRYAEDRRNDLLTPFLAAVGKFNSLFAESFASNSHLLRLWRLLHQVLETITPSEPARICAVDPKQWFAAMPHLRARWNSMPLLRYFGWIGTAKSAQFVLAAHDSQLTPDYELWGALLKMGFDAPTVVNSSANPTFGLLPNLSENFATHFQMVQEAVVDALGRLCESEVPSVLSWLGEMISETHAHDNSAMISECQVARFDSTMVLLLKKLFSTYPSALTTETPRLLHLLLCMCNTSFCQKSLEALIEMATPLIHATHGPENLSQAFEATCFSSLLEMARQEPAPADVLLLLVAQILPGLSSHRQDDLVAEVGRWLDRQYWRCQYWGPAACEETDPRKLRVKGLTRLFQQCAACKNAGFVSALLPKLGEAIDEYIPISTGCGALVRAAVTCVQSSHEDKQSVVHELVAASTSLQETRHWRSARLFLAELLHCMAEWEVAPRSILTSMNECISTLAFSAPQLSWRLGAVHLGKNALVLSAPANMKELQDQCLM
jgi:hypothetical protein